jgi:hypothetical protein
MVSIEFEGWENDPLPAVAETIGYAKGLIVAGKTKKINNLNPVKRGLEERGFFRQNSVNLAAP